MARKENSVTRSFTFEGKRYYVTASSEVEAEVKRAMKLRDLQEGKVTISGNMTVRQWAEICMETYKKPKQKEVTHRSYRYRMEACILRQIGDMPLKKVRPITCQQLVNNQAGKCNYHIRQTKQMLNFLFKYAVKEKLILENPAEYVVVPKGTSNTRRSLTPHERDHFLKVMDEEPRFMAFQLMYYASCRPGDAREVQGHDIILKDGYPAIHVRGTKTTKSDRYVPIPVEFYDKIKNVPPFCYVVTGSTSKMDDRALERAWRALCKRMNISMGCRVHNRVLVPPYPLADDLVPYCLRHTFCTELQKKGVDIRTAQYLMGHTDIQMTANVYTHADDETIRTAAEILCDVVPPVVPIPQSIGK